MAWGLATGVRAVAARRYSIVFKKRSNDEVDRTKLIDQVRAHPHA